MSKPLSYPMWLLHDFAYWLEHHGIISESKATATGCVAAYLAYKPKSYCFDDCDCGDLAYHEYLSESAREE